MHRDHHTRQRAIAAAADAVALTTLWVGVAGLRSLAPAGSLGGTLPLQPVDFAWHAPLVLLVVPAWLLALAHQDAWSPVPRGRGRGQVLRLARAAGIATLLVLGALFALHLTEQLSRTLVFGFALSTVPILAVSRRLQGAMQRRGMLRLDPWRILAVGAPGDARPLAAALARDEDPGIALVGVVAPAGSPPPEAGDPPVLGALSRLSAVLAEAPIDQVFLTGPGWSVDTLRAVADACEEQGVRLSMDANFLGLTTARAHLDDVEGQTVLSFSSTPVDSDALLLKRALDVLISAALLVLLAPVLLIVALAVRLSDGGPALFSQTRAGLHGRPFAMLKFRSMVVDAEARRLEVAHLNERDGPVFKAARDPRITRLGSFLRRSSLDELPQLWNVLRGQMSLVGPRPPIPAEVEEYERWQLRRLSMKPGITCIWQVEGRGDSVDFDQWMRQDLDYIDNWSLGLDLTLLARTVPVVLRGRGAR
jgi:exopolysaccharide biosynthesis polyprenyl glycosylphosphotransferase